MPCEVAKRAGFCVGVRRAVELAQQAAQCAKLRGIPCYSLGDVVHNPSVTQHLRDMGVQVVSRVEDAAGGMLILRSHGVEPQVLDKCREAGIAYVDCTCPHVQSMHEIVSSRDKDVVIVGERDHPEVQGTAGWWPVE